MSTTVLFEYPLNEKMRTWLRIEFLINQMKESQRITLPHEALAFFRQTAELIDVLERGDLRGELAKELDKHKQKLQTWSEVPGVDLQRVEALREELKQCLATLMSAPRIGQQLREERLINLVRQRLSIPGGCCSFDLPTLHIWLHIEQTERDNQVQRWITSLAPLYDSLKLILELLRQSAAFRHQTSLNGFFQDSAEGAELLRLQLPLSASLYPQVSGHKNRYAIRFLPLDSEQGEVPVRLDFDLACC
ncbi:MAG: Cell division protein ZapD [Candidatus Erwinia impunctatus]|nr:Cell division protein ZapD [Culicoides impunctatus]